MKRSRSALFLFTFAALLCSGCCLFRQPVEPGAPTAPYPSKGYEDIQKRIYYPAAVRNLGVEGTVQILAYIDTSGRVSHSKVGKGLYPALDTIALKAIGETRFVPARQRGLAVPVWISFPVEFSMTDLTNVMSPYERVVLELWPSRDLGRVRLVMRFELLETPLEPHRLEFYLPPGAGTVTAQEISGTARNAIGITRQSRDLEEWAVILVEEREFLMEMILEGSPEMASTGIQLALQTNHVLPPWECRIRTAADSPDLDFSTERSNVIERADGSREYRLKLPSLEAYETQHIELFLKARDQRVDS